MHADIAAWVSCAREPGIVKSVIRHALAMVCCDSRTYLISPLAASLFSMDSQAVAVEDETSGDSNLGSTPLKPDRVAYNFEDADVGLAQDGDHEAFSRLVASQQQRIAKTMWRFTKDRTE